MPLAWPPSGAGLVATLIKVPDMNSLLFVVPWLQQNALPVAQQMGPMLDAAWPYLEATAAVLKVCDKKSMQVVQMHVHACEGRRHFLRV